MDQRWSARGTHDEVPTTWRPAVPEKRQKAMKFRDPSIVPPLAASILQTLKLPKRHSPEMKQYRKKVLRCQCQELEIFLRFRKSVEAQKQADRLGIGDLGRFSWADQKKNGS